MTSRRRTGSPQGARIGEAAWGAEFSPSLSILVASWSLSHSWRRGASLAGHVRGQGRHGRLWAGRPVAGQGHHGRRLAGWLAGRFQDRVTVAGRPCAWTGSPGSDTLPSYGWPHVVVASGLVAAVRHTGGEAHLLWWRETDRVTTPDQSTCTSCPLLDLPVLPPGHGQTRPNGHAYSKEWPGWEKGPTPPRGPPEI